MRIYIMGSTAFEDTMKEHAVKLLEQGHEPLMPNFDSIHKTVLETLTANRELMEMSDEVHLIYDGRSYGSIFDFGMCLCHLKI